MVTVFRQDLSKREIVRENKRRGKNTISFGVGGVIHLSREINLPGTCWSTSITDMGNANMESRSFASLGD